MPQNYKLSDTEIVSVANAIRSKANINTQLEWPDGFISAINTIPTGGSQVTIVPWSTGTDEEIAAMISALDAGTLTIADTGWEIGDERVVNLSAMEATGVGESHSAQQIIFVLSNIGATAGIRRADGKTINFQVDMKAALNEKGYINSTLTSQGSWNGSARRAWCNDIFYNALPSTLKSVFKQMKVTTAEDPYGKVTSDVSTEETSDYFALRAEKEIFGSRIYAFTAEANALEQIDLYKTSSNKVKKQGLSGSAVKWWCRSPCQNYSNLFCYVTTAGGGEGSRANEPLGLSLFGCI